MQLFTTILAATALMLVSAEDNANPRSRVSPSRSSACTRSSRPSNIGGDSSVWGPSSGCDLSSSSFSSPCSSSWSSSSNVCNKPCVTALCNPFAPAVTPLCPPTDCEPLYGPNYGCAPFPGNGCAPFPGNGCAPFPNNRFGPCERGPRRMDQRLGNAQPWYIYLTATYTSTYETTTSSFDSTVVTVTTVSYTVFPLSVAPTTYYGGLNIDPLRSVFPLSVAPTTYYGGLTLIP